MTNLTRRDRSGFNLIEIAIVLAVIGLVIGGIYTATSAVTENNRENTLQKQVLVLMQNVRSIYVSQVSILPGITYSQSKAAAIMPGDFVDTGTEFRNPYGGKVFIEGNIDIPEIFGIHLEDIPQEACAKLVIKMFGTPKSFEELRIHNVHVDPSGAGIGYLDIPNISIQQAVGTLCTSSKNNLVIDAFLH